MRHALFYKGVGKFFVDDPRSLLLSANSVCLCQGLTLFLFLVGVSLADAII
jgi:hypothetical protein